jgi:hypothetical protein
MSILNLVDDLAFFGELSGNEAILQGAVVGTAGSGRPLASFLHDCRCPPITDLQRALRFYDDNYDIIAQYFLPQSRKVFLGSKANRQCRFCGYKEPDVTFRTDAHAIPEALGNKTLLSYYECDVCNGLFGRGIENDFGNWSKPMRTLARINGKKGFPTIKQGPGGRFRIEVSRSELHITDYEDNPDVVVNDEKKELTFRLRRDNYIPAAVLKALVKMGLTILPDDEIENFRDALIWIRETDHAALPPPYNGPVVHTFAPGPLRSNFIVLIVFRRKHDGLKVPYASFVLMYANEAIQVHLPSPERNRDAIGEVAKVFRFPHPSDLGIWNYDPSKTTILDLTGVSVVKGEVYPVTMSYETRIRKHYVSSRHSPAHPLV